MMVDEQSYLSNGEMPVFTLGLSILSSNPVEVNFDLHSSGLNKIPVKYKSV